MSSYLSPEHLPRCSRRPPPTRTWSSDRAGARWLSRTGLAPARLSLCQVMPTPRSLLGMPVHDATAGIIGSIIAPQPSREIGLADGFAGLLLPGGLTWRAVRKGLTVVEVPITLWSARSGIKMSRDITPSQAETHHDWGTSVRQARSAPSPRPDRREKWHTPEPRVHTVCRGPASSSADPAVGASRPGRWSSRSRPSSMARSSVAG